jgi:vancomycin aglycone glucosyltransferase
MRVILTSHGSTGDIYPIIGLAVAMQKAGHNVRFATIPHYKAEVENAGVEFYPLCPNWEQADLSYWMGRLQKIRTPIYQLREIYVGARPYIPEMIGRMDEALRSADLLVSSYLFPMNKSIADRRGVPFATFAFAHHVVPSPDYPPENVPSPKWLPSRVRRAWNRWLWQTANAIVDRVINNATRTPMRAAQLPKVRNFFSAPADRVLVGVSEQLMRPKGAQIDPRFRYTGYCRWQAPQDDALDRELTAFCAGEKVPILTFGSMVYENPGAAMERLVASWPNDRKLIVQRGWAQFPALSQDGRIKVIGKVSHDQLFRHASVIVHHGGAGTTASALHAGKPQIIVPHIGDQSFFGSEVERLGCGFRIARTSWPETLSSAIERLRLNPNASRNAERVQQILQQEDGPGRAIAELEQYVADSQRSGSVTRSTATV